MKTMYVTLRIDYDFPEDMSAKVAREIAMSLAIRPQYNSQVDGVTLDDCEVCGIEIAEEQGMERMLKELQTNGHIIVSLMYVEEFVEYCNERGIYPSGGAFIEGEDAQVLYI